MHQPRYYLGCPSWGNKDWVGSLYRRGSKAGSFLQQYSTVFNAVEGNTTFYSLPSEASVQRWREQAPTTFRFSCKLPRTVTHPLSLQGSRGPFREFLQRLAPLGPRLGPFMVQLPATFGPRDLRILDSFLAELPAEVFTSIEVRHPEFYAEGSAEQELQAVLSERGCGRTVMDTRALRAGDKTPGAVRDALRRKPHLPPRRRALSKTPILRFVGHPDTEVNPPWLAEWAATVARWIEEGCTPYVFVHCADDRHAPALARQFHLTLADELAIEPLEPWPGEQEREQEQQQLSLF